VEVIARLPDPGPEEVARSRDLCARIDAEIARGDGFLPFDRFMELALYTPGLGYYVAQMRQFGAQGDFLTAPEISPLFGAALAEQCRLTLNILGEGRIIEFGGGSGRMAASVLSALRDQGVWPIDYAIVELNPALRERQRETLLATDPALAERVQWWQGPPEMPCVGVVIANEVIDALPVSAFELRADSVQERGVSVTSGEGYRWTTRPASLALIDEINTRMHAAESPLLPYRSELNLRQTLWLADLRHFLQRGVVMLADYGYVGRDYYHPERTDGTLQCHYRHHVHSDPFWFPGLQDLTASVDFSALAQAATDAGFEVRGYTEQTSYLLSTGITERLAALDGYAPDVRYRAAQAVKTLLLPQAMGARVKFMSLSIDYVGPVCGYQLRDERHRL
jgi:SAM-dependent MidA family methyltransferase